MNDTLLNKKCPFELTWILWCENEEDSLVSKSFVLILDHLEGKEYVNF